MIEQKWLNDTQRHKTFPKGERIIPEGVIYIVVEGQIDIYQITPDKKLVKKESLGRGMSLGERSFFGLNDFYIYTAYVDTTVFEITKQTFEEIVSATPQLFFGLMQNFYIPPEFIPAPKPVAPPSAPPAPQPGAAQPAVPAAPGVQASGLFPPEHQGHPGVCHPEYEKLIFQKELPCPYCKKKFKAKKFFASKLIAEGAMRYDLRKKYKGFDTIWYDLLTCPHCYFSMFADTFATEGKLHPRMIQEVMQGLQDRVLLNFDAPRDIDFVFAAHYIALPLAEGYSNNTQILMKLWANLSWLYEEVGDRAMEVFAADKAARASERLYMESSNLNPTQEQLVCLSAAGMSYRAGQTDGNVMKWLFNAKTNRAGKQTYADLAEDLMEEIRAEQKKQGLPEAEPTENA